REPPLGGSGERVAAAPAGRRGLEPDHRGQDQLLRQRRPRLPVLIRTCGCRGNPDAQYSTAFRSPVGERSVPSCGPLPPRGGRTTPCNGGSVPWTAGLLRGEDGSLCDVRGSLHRTGRPLRGGVVRSTVGMARSAERIVRFFPPDHPSSDCQKPGYRVTKPASSTASSRTKRPPPLS